MRYLYQQLMAFWAVIAVILLTVGISFTQMTKQTIEESNYKQLFGYAESVEETTEIFSEITNANEKVQLQRSLNATEQILNQQGVNFVFVDRQEQVLYPQSTNRGLKFTISAEQWQALKMGSASKSLLPPMFLEKMKRLLMPWFLLICEESSMEH